MIKLFRKRCLIQNHRSQIICGVAQAYHSLSTCFMFGFGETIDQKASLDCLKKAAELGDSEAQFTLGYAYKYGDEGGGIEQNYELAVKFLHAAAEQCHSIAQCELLHCYLTGTGCTAKSSKKRLNI